MDSGKDIRTKILETLYKYGIKQIEVARETGMHHSTLCLWLQGKIKGHQVKIEETLNNWLQNLDPNRPRLTKGSNMRIPLNKPAEQTQTAMEIEKAPVRDVSKTDELITIKIDIESEGIRYKETICWNINEPYFTPESFAKLMAEENGLPPVFEHEISTEIKKSIQNHRLYNGGPSEMIRVIELDIRVENICLKDRFEWDINDQNNIPEDFALNLCNELGLNNEFMTLIAHSIREQIIYHQRQLLDRGFGGDFQLKKSMRSLIESGAIGSKKNPDQIIVTEENYLRSTGPAGYPFEGEEASRWEPRIEILDPRDIERIEKLEDRKSRYEKRRR